METPAVSSERLSNRPRHTRWLAVLLIPLIVVTSPPRRAEWLNETMEVFGIFCLVVCLVGRGWTSIYIAGRKDSELVQVGPYSIVEPLCTFSV